jgi:hypothetical protein
MGDYRHNELQNKLMNIKSVTGKLPPSTDLRGNEVRRLGQYPVAMGAQFDVWVGEFMGREKAREMTSFGRCKLIPSQGRPKGLTWRASQTTTIESN